MNRRITSLSCWSVRLLIAAALMAARPAAAHPMGNFSISHYARFTANRDKLQVRYRLDFAEIPTVSEMDKDGNGRISAQERDAYLRDNASLLKGRLALTVNGRPMPLTVVRASLTPRPGAGGLETMLLTLDMEALWPQAAPEGDYRIDYRDGNFPERTGWKEIVTVGGQGAQIERSSASRSDLSRELAVYPTGPGTVPPQQTEAAFTATTRGGAAAATADAPTGLVPAVPEAASNTPKDAFTQTIAGKLTFGMILFSLALAFVFGAFHALSPGHGKTMVAAYLVGTRGTAKHAAFLGAVVTITHTVGVFALGLVTLVAARYIVPEKLYPVLSALSGTAIVVIGVTLMRQRLAALRQPHAHPLLHDHAHTHDHSHEHPHVHDHADGVMWHDHGDGHYHSHHIPEDAPLSLKTLLVLGITGGALPCPSALVVMLSAIALHRVAFGLALITSFSLGLAAVLTGMGLLVVYARGFLERLPMSGRVMTRLPILSAAVVTVIGLALVVRAVGGGF